MTPSHPRKAYSYTRFSTLEQKKGKSFERQTEASENWIKQQRAAGNNVELDTELTLHDEGVSAFRGKNKDVGALGRFLKAAHAGQVPKGSYLLIETFDRMSRESAFDAQTTLQSIVLAGITVVTLMDGRQYNVTILRSEPFAMIYAILLMSRSHEESATKARRLLDAWARKRKALKAGEILTARTPGWIHVLESQKHGRKFYMIPDRAKIVKKIFEWFSAGWGRNTIAEHLNEKEVPTFSYGKRKGQWWTAGYVGSILTNRAVLGEFQPHKEDHTDTRARRKRIPDGPPIKNYYPIVVDRILFDRVQKKLKETTRKPPTRSLQSILAGIGRCPDCDAALTRVSKGRGASPRYICSRARAGAGCKYNAMPVRIVEQALVAGADILAAQVPGAESNSAEQIGALEKALAAHDERIFDLSTLLDGTPSKTLAALTRQEEEKRERTAAELEALKARASRSSVRLVKENARKLADALKWYATEPDVVTVNSFLRECFSAIVVQHKTSTLELKWRHGGTTAIPYRR